MSNRKPKKLDPLQKRVPANPKFKDVRATIDTGASLSKQLKKIDELKQNYKFSKDEIFKRMKITTFVQLVVQVYRLENDDFEVPDMSLDHDQRKDSLASSIVPDGHDDRVDDERESLTGRSTSLGVAQGLGEMDLKEHKHSHNNNVGRNTKDQLIISEGGAYSNNKAFCPYLLLDVRERDEYDRCRMTPALSYPKAMLSRSVNYESNEMLAFKNKEGKIIVLYDEDEKVAPAVATTLVQRGYDNIFMLSGGLKVAYKMFPCGLVTGLLPPSLGASKGKDAGRQVDPRETGLKKVLERDVEKMEIYLSNLMRTSTTGSDTSSIGRMSKASSRSSNSRCSSASLRTSRPAFKP